MGLDSLALSGLDFHRETMGSNLILPGLICGVQHAYRSGRRIEMTRQAA
jgi:hypothetical protein